MKILFLSTYPTDEPRHGGQHRLHNIIAAFRARGHIVYSAGVQGSPFYPKADHFVEFPDLRAFHDVLENYAIMEDWVISQLFGKEGDYFDDLSRQITINPDIIFVEQPWLFRFGEIFNKKRCRNRAILFYGSQNIEHRLKGDILKRYYNGKHVQECQERVLSCEVYAMKRAARTFCVSDTDLEWSRQYAPLPPILAANGVADRRASMADIEAANAITQSRKFAFLCASSHPPNMEGFFDIFGEGAGCFPPEARMVVAGGAGSSIANDIRLKQTGSLQRQFIDAGMVSENALTGLLATAHQIILPITAGGGTNLKSAEAIWSGQHIVATTIGMRGFEQFSGAPGVTIADDAPAFCNAIRNTFTLPNLALSIEERSKRAVVLWENTLAAMINTISNMELVA